LLANEFKAKLTVIHVVASLDWQTQAYYFANDWRDHVMGKAKAHIETLLHGTRITRCHRSGTREYCGVGMPRCKAIERGPAGCWPRLCNWRFRKVSHARLRDYPPVTRL